MSNATYYIGKETFVWPISSAMVCCTRSGSKMKLSALIEWEADHPSGDDFQWLGWIKDVALTDGHAKLTADELDGDNAGLYFGHFAELHSVMVAYRRERMRIEMFLIRADGTESDQRCCIDIEHWTEAQRHELRFP